MLPAIGALALAACDAPMETDDIQPLPDGELTGVNAGGETTLIVEGGEPIAYTFDDPSAGLYTASDVRRTRSGEIRVDQAQITGVEVDGGTVTGTWRLGGQTNPFEVSL